MQMSITKRVMDPKRPVRGSSRIATVFLNDNSRTLRTEDIRIGLSSYIIKRGFRLDDVKIRHSPFAGGVSGPPSPGFVITTKGEFYNDNLWVDVSTLKGV